MDLLQTHELYCPYCGEPIQIVVDCSIPAQEYIEDCQVCCRPISLHVAVEGDEVEIHATNENE